MTCKVIIIDDSETIRTTIRLALVDAGYDTIEAIDGVDGLAKLCAHRDAAVAICDVNMPGMNGIEMIEKAKSLGDALPALLVLTTEAQPSLVQRAKAAGAKAWMMKPFKADALVTVVRKLGGPPS